MFHLFPLKVNSNLSANNVEEGTTEHSLTSLALWPSENPFCHIDWQRKKTSQWQIFDVHNGLMSGFDRDIGGGGCERVDSLRIDVAQRLLLS